MTREIKFRVWDKQLSVMHPLASINFNGTSVRSVRILGRVPSHANAYSTPTDRLMANRIEVMQYTGLKDKNGVKIYEGDILKYKWCAYHSPNADTFEVEYVEAGFYTGNAPLEHMSCDSYEVIGNIYENPELLQ